MFGKEDGVLAGAAAKRTKMLWFSMWPEPRLMVRVLAKGWPPPVEISKRPGTKMVTSPVRLEPESCNDCSDEATPAVARNRTKEPSTLKRGLAVTVAETETIVGTTPVVETETLPDKEPAGADTATRTETGVGDTVAPDRASTTRVAKFRPLLETSNPFGTATVMSPVRLDPLTARD